MARDETNPAVRHVNALRTDAADLAVGPEDSQGRGGKTNNLVMNERLEQGR